MGVYDEVVAGLQAGKAASGLSCADVRALLTRVGFNVKDGKRGGHKVVTHPHLPGFYSTGYNCRGSGGPVDRNYLGHLLNVIRRYEEPLKRYLGEQ